MDLALIKDNPANAFLLFCLTEPHGQRRAAVPYGFGTIHRLRDVEVSKRHVIKTRGENPGCHMSQGSNIEFAHTIAVDGLPTSSEQMSHGNDGNINL